MSDNTTWNISSAMLLFNSVFNTDYSCQVALASLSTLCTNNSPNYKPVYLHSISVSIWLLNCDYKNDIKINEWSILHVNESLEDNHVHSASNETQCRICVHRAVLIKLFSVENKSTWGLMAQSQDWDYSFCLHTVYMSNVISGLRPFLWRGKGLERTIWEDTKEAWQSLICWETWDQRCNLAPVQQQQMLIRMSPKGNMRTQNRSVPLSDAELHLLWTYIWLLHQQSHRKLLYHQLCISSKSSKA